ncbi:MFS transporter [Streptomyces sp. NRRL B-24484]|uniref:MFS transporter n=1 Tax=Streptomyces sp. NRRL B-24484 TaxID=1463833 RepID=UPI0004C153F5|nr:MFS transporter [Streptomyces sp. NRRL B-24484]
MIPKTSGRPSLLREPAFRRYWLGRTTSLLGSAMASVAVAFAVLGSGGDGTALGAVMAARILPVVLVLPVGGIVADRLGARRTALAADALRCAVQAALAALLITDRPPVWGTAALVALWGIGEGFSLPALAALVPALVRDPARLADANSLLGLARSTTTVAGPALAGLLVAATGPAAVLTLDAASYAVGALALATVGVPAVPRGAPDTLLDDLRNGWTEFRSRTWLWLTTVQAGLFNLLVWAPFLVLGPLIAQQRLGGAAAWGTVMAAYGAGAVLGGLLVLGRRPRRPLAVATVTALGWALPSAALAAGAGTAWTALGALGAGVSTAVCDTLFTTATQQHVPAEALGRVHSFEALGAFVLGPIGLAGAGPLAARLGAGHVLALGALWQVAACAAVLAVPAVRTLRAPTAAESRPAVRQTVPSPD